MQLDEARALALQSLWLQDLRHLTDDELEVEREYCERERAAAERAAAERAPAELGDSMIPPECWRTLYAERTGWLQTERTRRAHLAALYRRADTGFTAEYVADVKAKLHLAEYIVAHHAGTKLRIYGGGRGFTGLCPWHADQHPSLGVWREPEWHWFCFVCLEGGDIFTWLLKAGAAGFKEAVLAAADAAGLPRPTPKLRGYQVYQASRGPA